MKWSGRAIPAAIGILAASRPAGSALHEKPPVHSDKPSTAIDPARAARLATMNHLQTPLTSLADEFHQLATDSENVIQIRRRLNVLLDYLQNVQQRVAAVAAGAEDFDEINYVGAVLAIDSSRIPAEDHQLLARLQEALLQTSRMAGRIVENAMVRMDNLPEMVHLIKLHLCGQTLICNSSRDWLLGFQGSRFHRQLASILRHYEKASEEEKQAWPTHLEQDIAELTVSIDEIWEELTPLNRRYYLLGRDEDEAGEATISASADVSPDLDNLASQETSEPPDLSRELPGTQEEGDSASPPPPPPEEEVGADELTPAVVVGASLLAAVALTASVVAVNN